MPEIAEAQALLAALAEMRRGQELQPRSGSAGHNCTSPMATRSSRRAASARRKRRKPSPEPASRTSGDKDAPERLAADYGLWAGSYMRGELPSMRAHAAAFLSDVEARPDSPEAGVAHRAAGITCWFAGEYREAREHLERALALFQPGRDDDLAFRFGPGPRRRRDGLSGDRVVASGRGRSRDFARRPHADADRGPHACRHARVCEECTAALFELMRGDHARAAPNAFELARLAREHDLPMFGAFGVFLEGWATAASGALGDGLEDMRRGVESLREQNVLVFDGLLKIALAEAEARGGRSRSRPRRPRRSAGDVPIAPAIARSKRNCIGRAAKSCSSATPPTPRPPKKPS